MKKAVLIFFVLLYSIWVSAQAKTKRFQKSGNSQKEEGMTPAIRQKIDSRLLEDVREYKANVKEGSAVRDVAAKKNRRNFVTVDISATVTDSLIATIKALGGTIIFPSKRYNTIRAEIDISMVQELAGLPAVKFIEPGAIAQLENRSHPEKEKRNDLGNP